VNKITLKKNTLNTRKTAMVKQVVRCEKSVPAGAVLASNCAMKRNKRANLKAETRKEKKKKGKTPEHGDERIS
jgi:hypothetical protein